MSDNSSKDYRSDNSSFWTRNNSTARYPALQSSIDAKVVVVGGGIAGLTAAYVLKKAGHSVVVIEKNTVASGTTGGTTGKVTVQQGIFYNNLIQKKGLGFAKEYARAYMQAFDDIEKLIVSESVDCDWSKDDNFVYTTERERVEMFSAEVQASAKLGFPASFETKTDLPFDIKAAVKFSDQAKFDAYKYCHALAGLLVKMGALVYENTAAKSIKETKEACYIETNEGSIKSKRVVIATKVPPYPLMARFTYGAIMYPETSYVVMAPYGGELSGMYISPDKNHYSILPFKTSNKKYLLIGGKNHIPGLGRAEKRIKTIESYGKEFFDVSSFHWKWKAMDYTAYDELPVIGKLYPWSKKLYVTAGFKKWGLVSSMVAANIFREEFSQPGGKDSKQLTMFSPHRPSAPFAIPRHFYKKLKTYV